MVDSKGRAKTGRAASKPTAPERAAAPRLVRKRDGRLVAFDRDKIELAVIQALRAAGEEDESFARDVARVVDLALAREVELATRSRDAARRGRAGDSAVTLSVPDIESIQDKVEQALIGMGRAGVARPTSSTATSARGCVARWSAGANPSPVVPRCARRRWRATPPANPNRPQLTEKDRLWRARGFGKPSAPVRGVARESPPRWSPRRTCPARSLRKSPARWSNGFWNRVWIRFPPG